MSDKTPDILIAALRQYQHNDCSGFVAGFDYAETVTIVKSLEAQRDELLAALKSLEKRASYMAHQCGYYQSDVVELVVAKDQIAKCEAQS